MSAERNESVEGHILALLWPYFFAELFWHFGEVCMGGFNVLKGEGERHTDSYMQGHPKKQILSIKDIFRKMFANSFTGVELHLYQAILASLLSYQKIQNIHANRCMNTSLNLLKTVIQPGLMHQWISEHWLKVRFFKNTLKAML